MYDYRGINGTGTAINPVSDKSSSNYVEYVVRKLADGNCWMSSNLKLTLSTSHSYEVATFSGGTESWTPNQDMSGGGPGAVNAAITINTKTNSNGGNWYFPWYAATAGQGTSAATPTVSRSICPKGWRLPSDENSAAKSWRNLVDIYQATTKTIMLSTPLNFDSATGIYVWGNYDYANYALYWSSTYSSNNSSWAYALDILSENDIRVQDQLYKADGIAIRCMGI